MHLWRVLCPYFLPYLPAGLGQVLAAWVPHANVQKMRKIVNEMDEQSRNIYNQKKAALEKGDEAIVQQIGEGKDIMSILSEYSIYSSCGVGF